MIGDTKLVEAFWNQSVWGRRMLFHNRMGWRILTPDQGLAIDGASHCVRGIDYGKQGW